MPVVDVNGHRYFHFYMEDFALAAGNSFVPIPPAAMITHISGQKDGDLIEQIRRVGPMVAADVFNTLSQAGQDMRTPGFLLVDLGCGCGRVAAFLTQILSQGRYLGLDVWREGIEWAQHHITPAAPHVEFRCLVEERVEYKGAQSFPIPLAGETAHGVTANSLFTHLGEKPAANYLGEIGRVLKSGGVAYVSCFVLDALGVSVLEKAAGNLGLNRTQDSATFSSGDFYTSSFDIGFFEKHGRAAGMQIHATKRGSWRGDGNFDNPAAFQDVVVLVRQ